MSWVSPFDFIHEKQPDGGYWIGFLRCITALWHKHLSLGSFVKRAALPKYMSREQGKAEAWVAELYASSAFVFALIALLIARPLLTCSVSTLVLGVFTVCWPVYRALEVLFLLLSWVFVDTSRLHSAQRSLVGFCINIAELSCLFGAVRIGLGIEASSDRGQIFVDGIIDLVTLSRSESIPLSLDGTLEAIRLFLGVFLVLVVVGSLVGGIARRTLVDDAPPGAPGDGPRQSGTDEKG